MLLLILMNVRLFIPTGDIHKFDWANIPHATSNASNKPRPMLVVTGVMSDTTRKILSKEIKKKI